MKTWAGLNRPITAQDAEREPLSERLNFDRRLPSWATRQALAQAEQHAPPLAFDDLARLRAKQRTRRAS